MFSDIKTEWEHKIILMTFYRSEHINQLAFRISLTSEWLGQNQALCNESRRHLAPGLAELKTNISGTVLTQSFRSSSTWLGCIFVISASLPENVEKLNPNSQG